jgi:phage-related protein
MSVETAEMVLLGGIFLVILILLIGLVYYGSSIFQRLEVIAQQLAGAFGSVFNTFVSISEFLVTNLIGFSQYLISSFDSFITRATTGMKSVTSFLNNQLFSVVQSTASHVLNVAATVARQLVQGFFNTVNGATNFMNQFTGIIAAVQLRLVGLITQGIQLIFNMISQSITLGFGFVNELIVSLIDVTATGVADAIELINEAVTGYAELVDLVKKDFNIAYNYISGILPQIQTEIQSTLCKIVVKVVNILGDICHPLATVFPIDCSWSNTPCGSLTKPVCSNFAGSPC